MYANVSTVVATPSNGRPGVTFHTNQSIENTAASRERLGELGFLVDGAFLGEGAEPFLVVALEVVDEVGVGPVGAFRPKARLAAGDRGPHLEVVAVAFVVGKDRRHRSGGRFGP